MSITKSDEGADKGISKMGVGLGPREGSNEGRTRDRMGGIERKVGQGGSDEGSDWRDWTGGFGQEGRTGGWTGGIGLGGSD